MQKFCETIMEKQSGHSPLLLYRCNGEAGVHIGFHRQLKQGHPNTTFNILPNMQAIRNTGIHFCPNFSLLGACKIGFKLHPCQVNTITLLALTCPGTQCHIQAGHCNFLFAGRNAAFQFYFGNTIV